MDIKQVFFLTQWQKGKKDKKKLHLFS